MVTRVTCAGHAANARVVHRRLPEQVEVAGVVLGYERGLDQGIDRAAALCEIVRREEVLDRLAPLVPRHPREQGHRSLHELVEELGVGRVVWGALALVVNMRVEIRAQPLCDVHVLLGVRSSARHVRRPPFPE